jgi:hypothetical protein
LLDSGFCDTVTWGALKKSWKGYKIAKSEFDYKMMEYYAMGIRKFQRELNVSVTEFPQKMPHERDPENAFYSYSYDQTQRELEDYELQLNQEQELDPYITEQEPNLLREQAEYNKRIRWEMYGAYFEW